MRSEFVEDAIEDFQDLSERQSRAVKEEVKEIEGNPTGHDDAKLIRIKGKQVYRVKVREERGAEIDHRIIYDVEGDKITIYSVFDRDSGYDGEELSERF